jgi:hypothetical protein
MNNFQPITANRYRNKYWRNHQDYAFAAGDALCPLVMQELPKAMLAMPIAFVADGESYFPVAVQGLAPGKNLFVATDGRWLTAYVPAPYRSYPFRMALTDQGENVLCVDDASSLISDNTGEPFFNEDDTPTKAVLEILDFFKSIDNNRELTRAACAIFQKYNLIQNWPIKIKSDQREYNLEGLFRIDEAALNSLPGDALAEVRNSGGLFIAYSQLLSMQHLAEMVKLAEAHEAVKQSLGKKDSKSNLGFMSEGSTFSFDS